MISKHFLAFRRISLLIVLSLLFNSNFALAQDGPVKQKTIMLILGSDNINTLKARVDIGYKLYNSTVDFDYIIVSGGCGAHRSKICEASEMATLLIEKGVPARKIIKEEKSKNTVQNYIYSRALKDSNGSRYINPNDSLYVVSNHWHAISVAARFTTYDQVHALYHVEGSIIPSTKDKVDYVDIFHKDTDNDSFVRKGLWPFVDASYVLYDFAKKRSYEKTYYFVNNAILESSDEKQENIPPVLISEVMPFLPVDWHSKVDASFYNPFEKKVYLFKDSQILRFSPFSKTVDKGYPKRISELVKDLPINWQSGFIDAAFFNPIKKEIVIFKGDECLVIDSKRIRVNKSFPSMIKNHFTNWPFQWGTGDIDAAHFDNTEKKIVLFRGKDYVKISLEGHVETGFPQAIKLEWPEAIFGKRN